MRLWGIIGKPCGIRRAFLYFHPIPEFDTILIAIINFNYMKFQDLFPSIIAEAHCDIPCGIYEPTPAKIAAKTVLRMVEQIEALALPPDTSDKHAVVSYTNSITRRIAIKEQHAEICKHELVILWSDFFKPEHLGKFPQLHDTFWKALKLCSKNKQDIDHDAASQLIAAVDDIAKMFYEAKGVPERFEAYKAITGKLY